jgi:hypothetical protein
MATPRPVVHETIKGADKILHPSKFQITSLDLGLKWRATTGSCGLWAAARACEEIPTTIEGKVEDEFTPAEDALMVMLLGGANPCRRNYLGELPMHWVQSAAGVKILADLGALETINAIDQSGRTPLHWAAELGQEPKAKMLIRLGADLLKRDPDKNTPSDVAKLHRHAGLHEILKWAQRKQANGGGIPTGGLVGESEMDRKARILRDDAEFARWKRAAPQTLKEGTYNRATKLPSHMQRRKWTGPLPNLVDRPRDVFKELSRHMSYWTNEQVALWISTEESLLEVFHDNSQDFNRRIIQCNVEGKHLAFLHKTVVGKNDPLTQFLGMLDFPPKEKKHIIKAIGSVLSRQKGLAPKEFRDAVEEGNHVVELLHKGQLGDSMLRREAQRQWDYHLLHLPVAIGKRSQFRLIGSLEITPLTSIGVVWERLMSDASMSGEIMKEGNRVFGAGKDARFWFTTPKDNCRLCLLSSQTKGSVAPDVSAYKLDPTDRSRDDGMPPVDINGPSQAPRPASCKGNDRTESKFGKTKDNENNPNIEMKLSGREIDDALLFKNMHDPLHAFTYPLLLIQPAAKEVLRGVEWTGTRMCRQWNTPDQLKNCENAWKLAHRYKIEGYESKKKWASDESKGLDQQVAELEGRKAVSPKKKKKWS